MSVLYKNFNRLRHSGVDLNRLGHGRFIKDTDYMVIKMFHSPCPKNKYFLRYLVVGNTVYKKTFKSIRVSIKCERRDISSRLRFQRLRVMSSLHPS